MLSPVFFGLSDDCGLQICTTPRKCWGQGCQSADRDRPCPLPSAMMRFLGGSPRVLATSL
ncbi:hypothetical protein BO94DRAFT_270036 [Aspergillus sclerotioniger CBS 115572]|uniref:Uncharacterized protein n=1 Tax=Aspergillus sclerotioniger CBS 115572 TaxID=1450535 RepID=A0A317V7L8_9EURO|nr:hypothetical protein BO94DRAFT_270036 [Aspergillus sclerotioniger CBS 115572]PWY70353.1 hypothetical protein BO94DRAFT_270036 [Aspergillus sclerotioniger CBS 115572]